MISIVIPSFERIDFLEKLLVSIKNQTYDNYEVIIVDDNSSNKEDYQKFIAKWRSKFKFFTYLRNNENKGAPYSRNKGIKVAKSNIIALVDDDDEWLSEKLEKQIKKLNEGYDIVYTYTDLVDENNNIIASCNNIIPVNLKKEILKGCFIPSPSVMFLKDKFIEAGMFDENFPSCQDWEMWTKMILKNCRCGVVSETLTLYRKHSQTSIGISKRAFLGYKMYVKKFYLKALKESLGFVFYYPYLLIKIKLMYLLR